MSNLVSLPADANYVRVGGGVYDDGSGIIAPLSINHVNGRLRVSATISGGITSFQIPTGALGQNTFIWAAAPNAIVVDGVTYQKENQDGTINWTGTTTTVLTFAPSSSIFAVA